MASENRRSFGFVSWLLPFFRETDRPTRDTAAGLVTLLTGVAVTWFLYWRNHDFLMKFDMYNLLNTAFILWVPLLVVMLFMRREPTEFGMTPGDTKNGTVFAVGAALLFTPIILLFAPTAGPQSYYLQFMSTQFGSGAYVGGIWAGTHWIGGWINRDQLVYHEIVMGFYMFGWEYFFRGYLLSGLRRVTPLWMAILIQASLFCLLHVGKPLPEVMSSFPGGILMGLIAARYRSFVPGFLLHYFISMGFDLAVLYYHFHPTASFLGLHLFS